MASQSENLSASIKRYVVVGVASVGILVVGLGGWAAVANISGAVVAPGQVQVKGNSKRIQHREGGIIGKIAVKDGDRVNAGDLLIQLDDTLVRTNLAVIEKQLVEFTARETRLIAERDDLSDVTFPEWLAELGAKDSADGRNALNAMRGEERLFVTRREMLTGQVAQLKERIQQFELQSEGLVSQRDAKDEEIQIIDAELESLQDLLERGLVAKPRVLELQRNTTRLRGEHGALISEIAVAKGRISETRLTIIQTAQDRQEEVLSQLRDVQAEIVRLTEQRIAARDQLRRIDIRAPQNGIIHELAFHTIGGVIQPGETILNIVPDGFDLIVEARVTPTDRDQTAAGQAAVITFSAFSQRTTPQMHGTVETISADLSVDEATGANYFSAQIVLNEGEKERLGDLELVPGMPAETFIQTEERTVLSFLLKPLTDNLRRAFREE